VSSPVWYPLYQARTGAYFQQSVLNQAALVVVFGVNSLCFACILFFGVFFSVCFHFTLFRFSLPLSHLVSHLFALD
jgi:hypothetical protein